MSTSMYIYKGDVYCEDCGLEIAESLQSQGVRDTGDSDDFPQQATVGEADYPMHCAKCRAFLENPLTEEGRMYVLESILIYLEERKRVSPEHREAKKAVLSEWIDFYGTDLLWLD